MEFNPTIGKMDTVDAIAVGANEENSVFFYREDHHGYDDFHLNSGYHEDESGFHNGSC